MTISAFVAGHSIAIARRIGGRKGCGVIVNEHVLPVRETRVHVEALSREFDLIHHDELLGRLSRPRPRPFCLLTFDDGKRSVATTTAAELERLGVPAVFYLPTRSVTDGSPLWFDRHLAIWKSLGHLPPELDIRVLKQLPLDLIDERLDRVCARHNLALDLTGDDVLPMSWAEARDLARRGFTIGAHSVRHAILTREPEARALDEIRQSIEDVACGLGTPCVSFAFPNGNYTARLARQAVECGARTVMTTDPAWVDGRFPCWRLPRVQLLGEDNAAKIGFKLALAATGRLLTNPDGTGRLYHRINQLCDDHDDPVGIPRPGLP